MQVWGSQLTTRNPNLFSSPNWLCFCSSSCLPLLAFWLLLGSGTPTHHDSYPFSLFVCFDSLSASKFMFSSHNSFCFSLLRSCFKYVVCFIVLGSKVLVFLYWVFFNLRFDHAVTRERRIGRELRLGPRLARTKTMDWPQNSVERGPSSLLFPFFFLGFCFIFGIEKTQFVNLYLCFWEFWMAGMPKLFKKSWPRRLTRVQGRPEQTPPPEVKANNTK